MQTALNVVVIFPRSKFMSADLPIMTPLSTRKRHFRKSATNYETTSSPSVSLPSRDVRGASSARPGSLAMLAIAFHYFEMHINIIEPSAREEMKSSES